MKKVFMNKVFIDESLTKLLIIFNHYYYYYYSFFVYYLSGTYERGIQSKARELLSSPFIDQIPAKQVCKVGRTTKSSSSNSARRDERPRF
jgi:hypothetical protein